MSMSVVIPTFNDRDHLVPCLDALAAETTDIETIVVNGPSTDGTSGMIRERSDVDVLLQIASRNLNVARNAGLREAARPIVTLLAPAYRVGEKWQAAIEGSLSGASDAASGPVRSVGDAETPEDAKGSNGDLAIHGGNLALTRGAITALDGFDEYLHLDGTADVTQRLAGLGLHVVWHPDMRVRLTAKPDGGRRAQPWSGHGVEWQPAEDGEWGLRYRSLTYRKVKNDGLRPRVVFGLIWSAVRDGASAARDVVRGGATPSQWVGNGVDVVANAARGTVAGFRARRADATSARNPYGISRFVPDDVIAAKHDWR